MDIKAVNNKYVFNLSEETVELIVVSDTITINVLETVVVDFKHPFKLHREGRTQRIDPDDKDGVGDVFCVLHEPVEHVHVTSEGEIAVVFSNGVRLESGAHPQHESWTLRTKSGVHLACLPGGGLSEEWGDHGVPRERAQ
jgi:hypothetical protein